jgi:hypothetical protein
LFFCGFDFSAHFTIYSIATFSSYDIWLIKFKPEEFDFPQQSLSSNTMFENLSSQFTKEPICFYELKIMG